MKLLTPLRVGLSVLLMGAGCLRLAAQQKSDEPVTAQVTNVRFDSNVRGVNNDNWYEIAIEVEAKPANPHGADRFVDRVRVTLNLGIEVTDDKGQKGFNFYRASEEAVALEQGKSYFRFYLPPEVVKRDGIRGDSKYYSVDVEAGGKPQPANRRSVSNAFNPASLQVFMSKVSSEGGANDGILQPQYLTPFAFTASKPAPTFVRSEH